MHRERLRSSEFWRWELKRHGCFAWMRDGCGDVVLLPPFVPRNSVSGLDQGEGAPVMGAVFDSVPVVGFNGVKARGGWFELVKGIRRNR